MPYYQIKHLQALSDYFELLGIQNISELPKGKGSLPQEDPQIFLGSVSMSMSSPLPASIHFDNTNCVPRDQESPFINPDVPLISTSSLTSPTSNTCPSTLKLPMTCLTYLGYNTPISLITVKPNTQSLIWITVPHGIFMLVKLCSTLLSTTCFVTKLTYPDYQEFHSDMTISPPSLIKGITLMTTANFPHLSPEPPGSQITLTNLLVLFTYKTSTLLRSNAGCHLHRTQVFWTCKPLY